MEKADPLWGWGFLKDLSLTTKKRRLKCEKLLLCF